MNERDELHGLDVALLGLDIAVQGLQELARHAPDHPEVQGLLWSCRVGRDLLDEAPGDTSHLLEPEDWPEDWRERILAACSGAPGARYARRYPNAARIFSQEAQRRQAGRRHAAATR